MIMAMIGILFIFALGIFVGFVWAKRYEQPKQREKGVPGSYHYRSDRRVRA